MSGPITDRRLPYPLPVDEQRVLKAIAGEILKAKRGRTEDAIDESRLALDIATLNMRDRIGVEVPRRCIAHGE